MTLYRTILTTGLAFVITSGLALADHEPGHDAVARGGIKALEERIWNLEVRPSDDTNAATECDGPRVFLDGEGFCVPVPDPQGQLDALGARIDVEEQARVGADQALRTDIGNEISDRMAADVVLRQAIDDIQLIPGPPGPQGDEGPPGPPGERGPPGPPAASDELSLIASYLGQGDAIKAFPSPAFSALHCTPGDGSAISVTVNGTIFDGIAFWGRERLSAPYSYRAAFESPVALDAAALTTAPASVTLTRGSSTATFSGDATAAGLVAVEGGMFIYAVEIRPKLSYLENFFGYRIWQDIGIGDIVRTMLGDAGASAPRLDITGANSPLEFAMQYNESDLDFVTRLMEEEGIFYYFDAAGGLRVSDNATFSPAIAGAAIYSGHLSPSPAGANAVATLMAAAGIPGKDFSVDSFDFRRPNLDLLQTVSIIGLGNSYEFQQGVTGASDIERRALHNRDRSIAAASRVKGSGNHPGFRAGLLAAITDNSSGTFGGSYLLTRVDHAALLDMQAGCVTYANHFEATPEIAAYKAPRITPKAKVAGPTTAIVVGPAGSSQHTDEFGRIKVQFHWDRDGAFDENASAWIRVMLPAGRLNDTALFIPQVGDEVVVDFLEGDPDLPIVLGSVYNASRPPPVPLP